jgi:DNA repair protein RadC
MCKADTIFRYALLAGAKSIIIGHNHPSGDPTPSESDVETTFQMVHAGSILGINVHDHIVFTDNTMWVSLKQKGYL